MGNKLRKQKTIASDKKKAPPVAPPSVSDGTCLPAVAEGVAEKASGVASVGIVRHGPSPGPGPMQPTSPLPLPSERPSPLPSKKHPSNKQSSLMPAEQMSPFPNEAASPKQPLSSQHSSPTPSPLPVPNPPSIPPPPPPPRYKPMM